MWHWCQHLLKVSEDDGCKLHRKEFLNRQYPQVRYPNLRLRIIYRSYILVLSCIADFLRLSIVL
jgi:hypothetical protein